MDLALVVGGAAREDAPVLDARLEGRPHPLVEGVDRLDVVVAVDDDRGRAVGVEPVGVDDRMAARLGDLDVLQADGSHALREPLGTGADIVTVGAEHPDGGDAQELDELLEALVGCSGR